MTRIATFERDENIRALARPAITMKDAAAELGMSRATIDLKAAHYGIRTDQD